jgi:RsiW-degrading membrane proteinase PrsW (M82 family)
MMSGIWFLLVLIITAALPVAIVFLWLRAVKSQVTPLWFLASLAAGMISLLAAVLIQQFFPPPGKGGIAPVLFSVFIRIALVEEFSRLISLTPLVNAAKRRLHPNNASTAALGFASGVGFSMVESLFYGISDIRITLLRAITAAPLHGACGIRAGAALCIISKHPVKALFFVVSAILIHATYNLILLSPAFPSVLVFPIAFAALFASLRFIKMSDRDDKTPLHQQAAIQNSKNDIK